MISLYTVYIYMYTYHPHYLRDWRHRLNHSSRMDLWWSVRCMAVMSMPSVRQGRMHREGRGFFCRLFANDASRPLVWRLKHRMPLHIFHDVDGFVKAFRFGEVFLPSNYWHGRNITNYDCWQWFLSISSPCFPGFSGILIWKDLE